MLPLVSPAVAFVRFFSFLAVVLFALPIGAAPRGWTMDYDAAVRKAKVENKILLLNFMGNRKTNPNTEKSHHELLLQDLF